MTDVRVLGAEGWAQEVARTFADELREVPDLRVCLTTGATPVPVYDLLATMDLDWSGAAVVLLDEFGDLPPGEPGGCDATLRRHLVDHVRLASYRGFDLSRGVEAECAATDAWLDEGLQLAVLGLGRNGHLGMNEPGSDMAARTHRSELATSTVEAAQRYFEGRCSPSWGVTVGLGDLIAADEVWVLATGAPKAAIVRDCLEGPVCVDVPGSLLQDHPNCTWWLDEEAAALLTRAGG